MQHWTKNGSIPSTETDGTEGWQHAPEPPTDVPTNKELVWLNWEWIIRDPKPQDRSGFQWNWQHDTRSWVEGAWNTYTTEIQPLDTKQIEVMSSSQINVLTTSQIVLPQ